MMLLMRVLLLMLLCLPSVIFSAEVMVTPQTGVAACVQAASADDAALVLKVETYEEYRSPHFERLLAALEEAGVHSFEVRIRDDKFISSSPVYSEVMKRVGNPAGKGWVQYEHQCMLYAAEDSPSISEAEETELVVSPFVQEVKIRTPGGKLLMAPYESMEANDMPWSPDGRYLVLAGSGNHYIFESAALDSATEPDWQNQHCVEGRGTIRWINPHTFEFSTWCCGCSHSEYRYDIETKTLTLLKKVRNKLKWKG